MLPEVVGAVFMRSYSWWQENTLSFFSVCYSGVGPDESRSLKSQNQLLLKHAAEYVCERSHDINK